MFSFSDSLLRWYEQHRRYLPWREEPTPYRVLVSEIMLQQTRVDTVIPYFERFLTRFPSFEALADASEEEVLVLWQGLGYYSRARNLHAAAKMVVSEFGGELPRDVPLLKKLPGVGEYVSHAVAAIAFDEPYIAVDGNLLRVYARLNAAAIDVGGAPAKKACESFYLERIDSPSSFNQALMDLGELVCAPSGMPRCEECPFRAQCKGKDNPLAYPLPKQKPALKKETLTVLIVRDEQGRIGVRKRADSGLLKGMHEFPNFEGRASLSELNERYPSLKGFKKTQTTKHRFSHVEWTMVAYEASGVLEGLEYASAEELKKRFFLPTAFSKLLKG